MTELEISIVGDSALNIVFGSTLDPANGSRTYDPDAARHVRCALELLEQQPIQGTIGATPAYCALTIYYDPLTIGYDELVLQLNDRLANLDDYIATQTAEHPSRTVIKVPVCYGDEFGPDLEAVAQSAGISADEVIKLHSAPIYEVGMHGFYPGFTYLTGLDRTLNIPRSFEPHDSVPAGSVGIGGRQTGIYALTSPGDWHVIGRTPLHLFDINRKPALLLQVGQGVEIEPISAARFKEISQQIAEGDYEIQSYEQEV